MPDRILTFPPFTLDLDAACLRRGRTRRPLTPKDFALLHYLVTHPGQVVSHAELLRAVWADTVVSPEVLKVRVGRLRRLLGDKVAAPRFIANVHGEGYRFIGQVVSSQHPVVSREEENQKSKGKNQKAKGPLLQSAIRNPHSIWWVVKLNSRNCTGG